MATKSENDDLITCPICFEQFTRPKYLPCLHTFCHQCLKSYIITQLGEGKKSQQFPCPVCRHTVTITDQTLSSEKIADTMPGNHLIASLIERSKGLNKSPAGKLCNPCGRDNQELSAIYWCTHCFEALCENCTTSHKRLDQSRHVLIPVSDMERSTDLLDIDEPCMKHTGKVLEVYCMDHKEMCCVICLTTLHRKCEHVKTFEEMVNESKDSEAVEQFANNLNEIDTKTDELRAKIEENVRHLDTRHEEISQNVSSTIQQAKDKLDHLQSKFELKFQQQHKEESMKLTEKKERIEIFQNSVKKGQKLLSAVRKHGSPKQLFITKEKLKIQMKDHVTSLKEDLQDVSSVDYTLKLDDVVASVSQSVISVAEVDFKSSSHLRDVLHALSYLCCGDSGDASSITAEHVDIMKLKVSRCFDIRTHRQELTGGTYLSDGRLVLCNSQGSKLQAYDKAGVHLFETARLDPRPSDACCLSDSEIAASFSDRNYIKKYEVTQNAFTEKCQIICKNGPWGLAATKDSIIVGYAIGIDVLSLDGTLIKTLSSKQGEPLSYVNVSSTGNVYYSDGDNVLCKTLAGTELARYNHPNLRRIFGIAVDKFGCIYACGSYSRNVFVFSPDGKKSKLLFENLKNPYKVGFDTKGECFFLTSGWNGGGVYKCSFTS